MPGDPRVHVEINVEETDPNRCECGHDRSGYFQCINSRIYGPCSSEFCGGVCEDTWGTCKGDCRCERGEY